MRYQAEAHARNFVTKTDLGTETESREVEWIAPALRSADRVLRGNVGFMTVQDGLTVHYSNAEDLHDLRIETDCAPRLTVSIFLEGSVDASIGALRIPMPSHDPDSNQWQPVAMIFSQAATERFRRSAHKGMRLKKVVISVAPHWLEQRQAASSDDLATILDFARCHLALRSWLPSAHAVGLAEQIVNTPASPSFVQTLHVESRVLGLLEEAFRHIAEDTVGPQAPLLRPQDRRRLRAIDSILDQDTTGALTVRQLGLEVGLSTTSLQRLFTSTHGVSVSRYIRQFKLEKSREALETQNISIAEAAYIAGYKSPANFATAFKRCFGLSPSSVREG